MVDDPDSRTIARELQAMSQKEFNAAFKGSPIKRAKLRGVKRDAAVVVGNVATADDADVLTRALDDSERLVREPTAWAIASFDSRRTGTPAPPVTTEPRLHKGAD